MRRFIAHLLILSVLVTNVAWAMDDCSWQYSNDIPEFTQLDDVSSDRQNDNDDSCFGWLHLVAITPATKLDYFSFAGQDVARTGISFHSLDQAPPIRPPQI